MPVGTYKPRNKYIYNAFIANDLSYSHYYNEGMKISFYIFSRTLQIHNLETLLYSEHALHVSTMFSTQEFLTTLENTFRLEFFFNKFIICCATEAF